MNAPAYTMVVPKNKPFPMTTIALPAINMVRLIEAASKVVPMPKMSAPRAIAGIRPSRSAIFPANKEIMVAEVRIVDTTRPCINGDMGPK